MVVALKVYSRSSLHRTNCFSSSPLIASKRAQRRFGKIKSSTGSFIVLMPTEKCKFVPCANDALNSSPKVMSFPVC